MTPTERLHKGLKNGEHIKLALKLNLHLSARLYSVSSGTSIDDVGQTLAVYLLHLQANTNCGWDPSRGAWSTWVCLAAIGLAGKWARRAKTEESARLKEIDAGLDDLSINRDTPEMLLTCKETYDELLLSDASLAVKRRLKRVAE